MKIGVVYGNPETTTGGNALKFYASVRLDIRRKKPIKRGEDTIGSECKVKVVKNKMAPPFREADFEILYGTGINKGGELVDTAQKLGLVEKSGTWYAYAGEKLGRIEKAVYFKMSDLMNADVDLIFYERIAPVGAFVPRSAARSTRRWQSVPQARTQASSGSAPTLSRSSVARAIRSSSGRPRASSRRRST